MYLPRARLATILTIVLATVSGCEKPPAAAPSKVTPAEVAKLAHEDELNTIRLTPQAAERLGIAIAPVERRNVARFRTYAGEYVVPVGASLIVSAPVGGTLQSPTARGAPRLGMMLADKQPVFLLLPLLSPERSVLTPAERIRFAEAKNTVAQARIDAEGQVQQASVQVEAAQIALDRAQRLLTEKAGTARAVDDAQAQLQLAQKTLAAAENRKKLVDEIKLDEEPGTLEPLVIESPRVGMLRSVQVAPGAVVVAGAPLFEVMDFDPLWVKASVYAGELAEIAADLPAQISDLSDRSDVAPRTAPPIAAPPTAAPLTSTVDLYYEVPNPEAKLRPGERVTVRLPIIGEAEAVTIPWSAVMHDVQGGTWVYEQTAPHTFVRRRVEVRHVLDGTAVLERGPAAGASIVTAGVVELYGTEFGFAK